MTKTDYSLLMRNNLTDDELIDLCVFGNERLKFYIKQSPLLYDFTTIEELEKLLISEGNEDEEYAYYPSFDAALIAKMMVKGLFPMAMELTDGIFLPIMRHHDYKCVIRFDTECFTYHKSIRRYARKMSQLTLCFDRNFFGVINGIKTSYQNEGTWLAPKLVAVYKEIFDHNGDDTYPVEVHSVEVYDGDRLVAGEIGFISGDIYTSLSGFHLVPNTGSIQMAALGTYLQHNGFSHWDLGMQMNYKWEYGSLQADRAAQAFIYRNCPMPCLPLSRDEILIKDLLYLQ